MLKYATQARVGDRMHLRIRDSRQRGGERTEFVMVTDLKMGKDGDSLVMMVCTDYGEVLYHICMVTSILDLISEDSVYNFSMFGDVFYETLQGGGQVEL